MLHNLAVKKEETAMLSDLPRMNTVHCAERRPSAPEKKRENERARESEARCQEDSTCGHTLRYFALP